MERRGARTTCPVLFTAVLADAAIVRPCRGFSVIAQFFLCPGLRDPGRRPLQRSKKGRAAERESCTQVLTRRLLPEIFQLPVILLFSWQVQQCLVSGSHNLYQHRPKQRRTRGAVCRDEDTAESMGAICSSTNGAVSSPVKNAGNDDKVGNGAVLDEHATACHGNATGEPHK